MSGLLDIILTVVESRWQSAEIVFDDISNWKRNRHVVWNFFAFGFRANTYLLKNFYIQCTWNRAAPRIDVIYHLPLHWVTDMFDYVTCMKCRISIENIRERVQF